MKMELTGMCMVFVLIKFHMLPNKIARIKNRGNLLCDSRLEESPILMMRLSHTLPAQLACNIFLLFKVNGR